MYIYPVADREWRDMRISLADSTESGFKQWSAAHTEGRDRPAEGEECGPGIQEPPSLDGPHQPWLVPGVGNVL